MIEVSWRQKYIEGRNKTFHRVYETMIDEELEIIMMGFIALSGMSHGLYHRKKEEVLRDE